MSDATRIISTAVEQKIKVVVGDLSFRSVHSTSTVSEETGDIVEEQTSYDVTSVLNAVPSRVTLVDKTKYMLKESIVTDVIINGRPQQYAYNQASPASIWVVNHNLGYYPSSVTVLNNSGQEVEADIIHISTTQLTVNFCRPYSGTVRIL